MKKLSASLISLLLSAAIAPASIAGAPPKVDPNAPPPVYWEPEAEQEAPVKKEDKKAKTKAKKEKKEAASSEKQ